jgi:hypothetical protein
MSHEELERRMAFIVEQQGQFASNILQLREAQAQTEQIVAHTGQIVGQTGEIVTRLANVTLEGFKDVNARINALVDSQIHTDENLRNLVAVVDASQSEKRWIVIDLAPEGGIFSRHLEQNRQAGQSLRLKRILRTQPSTTLFSVDMHGI